MSSLLQKGACVHSYSQETPVSRLLCEAQCLFWSHQKQTRERVAYHIRTLRDLEATILHRFHKRLQSLDILDVGPGQFLLQMMYFAQCNRVVGIDLDVIARGCSPLQYIQMCRHNGARRTLKTVVRKLTGIDRGYVREMRKQLRFDNVPDLRVLRMDACKITFDDASYDFVHSRSVFHHLPDPDAALSHVARILRPEGVASLSFHLFTSQNGSLDPRIFTERSSELDLWPHLRSQHAGQFQANAFVNKLRLQEWRRLFAKRMPGCQFILNQNRRVGIAEDAERLIRSGELADYTLEELVTDEVVVLWQKPANSVLNQLHSSVPVETNTALAS